MKRKLFWRQGDVGILKVDKIPTTAKEIKHDGVLAYGETTGHKHQLIGNGVKYFRDGKNDLYFEITSRFVSLNHGSVPSAQERADGHFAHKLPVGVYKMVPQIEWNWIEEMVRNVTD